LGLYWAGLHRSAPDPLPPGAPPQAAPAAAAAPSATSDPAAPASPAAHLAVKVLSVRPHDATSYTQGLVLDGGVLYESGGQYGSSSLRREDPKTGKIERRVEVPEAYFAEGLAKVGERLVQLTWREGKAFVYRASDLAKTGELAYVGEGWGLCYDGKRLVMSDGSAQLTFRDPQTLEPQGHVQVLVDGRPAERLNELECVGGSVYANVWQSDDILRIDPATGRVLEVIDAAGLLSPEDREGAEVLNGIAYDAVKKTFLITGKHWPKMFEVEFVKR
jgi:glutaminyl-peptide cyclotransferase